MKLTTQGKPMILFPVLTLIALSTVILHVRPCKSQESPGNVGTVVQLLDTKPKKLYPIIESVCPKWSRWYTYGVVTNRVNKVLASQYIYDGCAVNVTAEIPVPPTPPPPPPEPPTGPPCRGTYCMYQEPYAHTLDPED